MPNYSMPAEHQRNVFINHAYHSHDPVSRRGRRVCSGAVGLTKWPVFTYIYMSPYWWICL